MKDKVQIIKETLQFQDLTPEEKEKRGILGRLYGPCASITIPTRNGRTYNEKLWDYQFSNNEILKEMFENGGVPMELDHPQDREETQSDKIAAMMPEPPKKDKDGHLITYIDIIDTPMGKIAYQLAKYGFKLGISSRGTGDLITDENGNEAVDPETYDLTTFDLVLVPAVKDARLTMCESLDKDSGGEFKKALCECLDKASKEDKESLTEAINNLGIDINNDADINDDKDTNNTSKQTDEKSKEAIDDGSNEIIKSLQEAIKEKTKLEGEIKSLQEKLAVSDTKVGELNEELSRYKSTTMRLSSVAHNSKELSEKVSNLEEELGKKDKLIESLKSRNSKLIEARKGMVNATKPLNESIRRKVKEIKELNESISSYESKMEELNEQLNVEKDDLNKQLNEMSKKVSKSNQLVESYKTLANNIVERYIETKATMLGVNKNEIKNKLDESYTLDDIDEICDELQSYALNISKLPFSLTDKKVKVQVTESKKEPIMRHALLDKTVGDDDVDDDLLRVAGNLISKN